MLQNIKGGNNLIYVGKEPTSWTANNGGGAFSFEMNNPQFINENISTINLRLSENVQQLEEACLIL